MDGDSGDDASSKHAQNAPACDQAFACLQTCKSSQPCPEGPSTKIERYKVPKTNEVMALPPNLGTGTLWVLQPVSELR